ncbi:MAG: hypothetical protein KC620_07710, partial [Myxococcales bacterium]|nr:hypothetical protein [Myxococcales bacterium]
RNGRQERACIEANQCDGLRFDPTDPCEMVKCDGGLHCVPGVGDCVECLSDDHCGGGETCVDNACEPLPAGADREASSWDDGNQVPQCQGQGDCTADEECRPLPGLNFDTCLLACDADLACPPDFQCCNPRLQGDPYCISSSNRLIGVACQ